ncbi:helix-turn-helix domain-containing protein [Alteribacillus sp. JSM 102045]|uniref:helix-turn-helix domain-containing protein n=1 Tax=Alteribacillus sp. JSM 102045 TaxID=1562101 RepID=UPI0035C0B01F
MDNLSFRQYLFLYLLGRFNGDRSSKSIFHLLNGKRSSQTIQDSKWYGVSEFFSMLPKWTMTDFDVETRKMENQLFIVNSENKAKLTEQGKLFTESFFSRYSWPSIFNGWKYGQAAPVFWKRIALTIQSLSFSLSDNRKFLPVFDDIKTQRWLKQRWPRMRAEKEELAYYIYKDLYGLLNHLPEKDASVFAGKLSGHQYTGQTLTQLAAAMNEDIDETYFRFQSTLHYLLAHAPQTTYLKEVAEGLLHEQVLTSTTKKTKRYLHQGLTIDEIAEIRGLKKSTIEDHIVELVSEGAEFSVEKYVSKPLQKRILTTVQNSGTYRLKVIKETLANEGMIVDYFSIRLTLAFFGGGNENAG